NYFYKRTLLVAFMRYTAFGDIRTAPKMSVKQFLSMLKLIMVAEKLTLSERMKWIKYNLMLHNSIKHGYEDFNKLLLQGADTLEANCADLIKKGLERV